MTQPRWIIHSDGRVSEFDRSQIAADVYRARSSHERQGAALFAAELSQAIVHFAARAFESPVWRSSRLKGLAFETLRELGHVETANALLAARTGIELPSPPAGFSPDLFGLVEEGVLELDLSLYEPRIVVLPLDAIRAAGAAASAMEFIAGLREPLSRAARAAESVVLKGADVGVAMLHQPWESLDEAAVRLREVVSTVARQNLARIVIHVRPELDFAVERRLSSGPLFPFLAPADAADFHRRLGSCLKSDAAVDASLGGESDSSEHPLIARIGVRFGSAIDCTRPMARDLAVLDATVRAAGQRRQALREVGVVELEDRCAFKVRFLEDRRAEFLLECRANLHRLAELHQMTATFA